MVVRLAVWPRHVKGNSTSSREGKERERPNAVHPAFAARSRRAVRLRARRGRGSRQPRCALVSGCRLAAGRCAQRLEKDYLSVRSELGTLLHSRGVGSLVTRPWPGSDHVRPARCTHMWLDLFVLRRFESREDLAALLRVKANGQPQPAGYCEAILARIDGAAPRFPLWHYDSRKAIELWPREFFADHELLPLRRDLPFGPLAAPCVPARPVGHLLRAYGADVFTTYRR